MRCTCVFIVNKDNFSTSDKCDLVVTEVSQVWRDLKFFRGFLGVVNREDVQGRGRRSRVCGPNP